MSTYLTVPTLLTSKRTELARKGCLFVFLTLLPFCCIGSTWTGAISSDWYNANNWSPVGVPGSGATINITNGTINLSAVVSISGVLNWSGGTLGGKGLTIASGGAMNVTGNVALENPLTNSGSITMAGAGVITLYNNVSTYTGEIYNLSGGLWDIQTNAQISSGGYGHEFFNNAGTLRRSQGTSTAVISLTFTNSGIVTNLASTLDFYGGGSLEGTFGTDAGAVTTFGSGNFTIATPPTITGAGSCEFTGSTLTLLQNWPSNLLLSGGSVVLGPSFQNAGAITNLTLSGATLAGTNTVKGNFLWAGGVVVGPMTVASSGAINITGSVALENLLTNSGTVTMAGAGQITLYNNQGAYLGGVYNQASALWDIQTNASVYSGGYGHEFFHNAGTLQKSLDAAATTVIGIAFTNSNAGVVSNLAGMLEFTGGGQIVSTYDTEAGASTYFASGSFTVGAAPDITGAGLCEFEGSTLTLTENPPANLLLASGQIVLGPAFQEAGAITNLTLSGATLDGTNTVKGNFLWAGGVVVGPITVASGGTMNITGSVALENVLTNSGTVTMTGTGEVTVYNNVGAYLGAIYNLAAGLWDIQTNAGIYSGGYGHEFFHNAGTLQKSLDVAATIVVGVAFTNSATGVVSNLAGSLEFTGGGQIVSTYDTEAGATTYFASGSFVIGTLPTITGPGLCEFLGATLTLLQNPPVNLPLAGGSVILGPSFQNAGAITNLTLSGAELDGTNTLKGTLFWGGSTFAGPMTVASDGVLYIDGGVALETPLTNAGTVIMNGAGQMTIYNNQGVYTGEIYNQSAALWDIQTNASIYSGGYGHEFFYNSGNFRRSMGAGICVVSVSFTNAGTFTELAGPVEITGGFNNASGTLAFGLSGPVATPPIYITTPATLSGTLNLIWLDGFTPVIGNSFSLIQYPSESGTFANIDLPGGATATPTYGPTVFSLQLTSLGTQTNQPVLDIQHPNAGSVVVSWPAVDVGFTLQTTANLTSPWADIASGIGTVGTNFTFTNAVGSRSVFFRLQAP